jgi:hypothetical protein
VLLLELRDGVEYDGELLLREVELLVPEVDVLVDVLLLPALLWVVRGVE